jgi:hypothetical protein
MKNKKYFDKLISELQSQKDYVTDYPKIDTLKAISDVETRGGEDIAHKVMEGGMHSGSSAVGKYGLMPSTIKETEKSLSKLSDDELKSQFSKNPELEEKVASKYYDRLREQLGSNAPENIGYGWLQGITGAKKALKEGKDIDEHWHVQKIKKAHPNPLILDSHKRQVEEPEYEQPEYEEEPSISEMIQDKLTDAFNKIDPVMIRERRIEEKQKELEQQKENEYFQKLMEQKRLKAEIAKKKNS